MTDDELLILNVLKGRFFMPIGKITTQLFDGDERVTGQLIRRLADKNMLQYTRPDCVTITAAGKMNTRSHKCMSRAFK